MTAAMTECFIILILNYSTFIAFKDNVLLGPGQLDTLQVFVDKVHQVFVLTPWMELVNLFFNHVLDWPVSVLNGIYPILLQDNILNIFEYYPVYSAAKNQ